MLINANDERKTAKMFTITLTVTQDEKGIQASADYNVVVQANMNTIWTGRVVAHDRKNGWPALLWQLVQENFGGELMLPESD